MEQKKRVAILGASRGLGRAIAEALADTDLCEALLLSSRNEKELQSLKDNVIGRVPDTLVFPCDFSVPGNTDVMLQVLHEFSPSEIIYAAGGGPYGKFHSKHWKDHVWALNVNFLFPAELLHRVLQSHDQFSLLKTFILIGSDIAEDKPDSLAASYCAGKHALRGLVGTIQTENPPVRVELFSPGYMDTALLPPNAWPRQQGMAESPKKVAHDLLKLI